MPRIMNKLGWSVSGAVALGLLATLAGVIYAGPLDPPKPPAPTQANLIFQPASCAGFPIFLAASGSYKLAEQIVIPAACAADGIMISSSGSVTLDLGGFKLQGNLGAGTGITTGIAEDLVVVNGTIRNWPSGGINFGSARRSRLAQLEVEGNGPDADGGQISLGGSSTLHDCIVAGGAGLTLGLVVTGSNSVVDRCVVSGNGAQGLEVTGANNRITNNHAVGNDTLGGGNCADIWVHGPNTVVEDNSAETSGSDACPFFIDGGGTGSIIVRNMAHGGGGLNFDNVCGGGCDVGPVGTAALSTSPSANISD